MLNYFFGKKEEEKKNPFAEGMDDIVNNAFDASYPEYVDSGDELNTEEMDFEDSYEAIDEAEMQGLSQDAGMEVDQVVAQLEEASKPQTKARRGHRK